MINEQPILNKDEVKLLPPLKSITDTAIAYLNNGLSVIPTTKDKNPTIPSWTHLQTNKPHINEVTSWWPDETGSIGIICGQISGNLEVIDFDEKYNLSVTPLLFQWQVLVDQECPGLSKKLIMQKTQNNGYHALYRCKTIQGSMKLAQRAATEEELKADEKAKSKTLIETRGEKGYIACYPSKGYSIFNGDFKHIPEITVEERDILLSCARSLNLYNAPSSIVAESTNSKNTDPTLPGNVYVERGDHKQLLEKYGWAYVGEAGDNERWRRPGKREGISASFRKSDGLFYVFSSNAGPFENGKAYNKFSMFTQLEADGNYKDAAKKLALLGFGELKSSSKKDDEHYLETEAYLSSHYDFRLNLITGRLEMKQKHENTYHIMEDVELNSIHRELKKISQSIGKDGLYMLLYSDFTPTYDPFKEYFNALPEWDGSTDHIAELVDTLEFKDSNEKKLFIKYLKRWLVGLVACATEPQSINQSAIILVGKQGIGKSRWLNYLVPKTLSTYKFIGTIDPANKDTLVFLSECLLINLDELETLKKPEIGGLKYIMTLPSVKVRRPYDRLPQDMIRRASFVGSINNSDFLNDPTGSRRFLVFEIENVLDFQKIDMDKVYSQVKYLLADGEQFWFSEQEINEITEKNKKHTLRTYEHELVNEMCKPGNDNWYTSTQLAEQIQMRRPSFKVDKASVRNIGYALTHEGFKKKASKGYTKYSIAWKDVKDISDE
jgi:hypothetical protein